MRRLFKPLQAMESTQQVTSPGETVLVGCFVDPILKRRLLDRAKANERTLSGELRLAIARHLHEPQPQEHGA